MNKLDLSFSPVKSSGSRNILSIAEIEQYNELGYVQPFTIFDDQEISGIRGKIDGWIRALGEDGNYGINCYQSRLSSIWDIANDSRILDHVEDILGPNIICWASAILSKKPYDPKQVPWHQDASFWKLSPARTVTVWLAIDDADEENSAMRFIPGTHKNGEFALEDTDENSVFHIETAGADQMGEPFVNTLKAGQISLHADMLVHGSLANQSDRRRCGLTLRYCPPEVEILDAKWAEGVEAIICRGEDASGQWVHHERPQNDDITKTSSPHVIGNN